MTALCNKHNILRRFSRVVEYHPFILLLPQFTLPLADFISC